MGMSVIITYHILIYQYIWFHRFRNIQSICSWRRELIGSPFSPFSFQSMINHNSSYPTKKKKKKIKPQTLSPLKSKCWWCERAPLQFARLISIGIGVNELNNCSGLLQYCQNVITSHDFNFQNGRIRVIEVNTWERRAGRMGREWMENIWTKWQKGWGMREEIRKRDRLLSRENKYLLRLVRVHYFARNIMNGR